MKRFLTAFAFCLPLVCTATVPPLEFELIRTPETPGFFSVTIFPTHEALPLPENILFVKNFKPNETPIYGPIVNFLTELGAQVTDVPSVHTKNRRIISLGGPLPGSKNFSSHDAESSLEQFENFSLNHLKPVFLRNPKSEFGGNISDVLQTKEDILDEKGITFIGKFEKDMRTRMALSAENESTVLHFETPLDLTDFRFTLSPLAKKLPELWEQLYQEKNPPAPAPSLSLFPWIIGAIGIWIVWMVFFVKKRRIQRQKESSLQTEFPWKTISAQDDNPADPFELS